MMLGWICDKASRHRVMEQAVAAGLAVQFRMLREQRGMTQAQFADFLGISQSQVSKYETTEGMRNVTTQTLFNIACKCDVAIICRFISWREWLLHYLPFLPINTYDQERINLLITPEDVFKGGAI